MGKCLLFFLHSRMFKTGRLASVSPVMLSYALVSNQAVALVLFPAAVYYR